MLVQVILVHLVGTYPGAEILGPCALADILVRFASRCFAFLGLLLN